MADITPNVVVSMPSQLFTLRRAFKSCSNGKVYIGKIDTDPTIAENQIPVYLENEDGKYTPVAQPLIIGTGGYPVYNGQIAKFVTVEGHAMAVYDGYGVQQFYFPNVLNYEPKKAIQELHDELNNIPSSIKTLVSRGRVPALSGNNQGTSGIQLYEAYGNGYPTPYGNVIHLKGASAGGEGELLIGWSGTRISGAHAPLYIRSRRDVEDAPWSAWAQIFTANELAGIPLPFPGEAPPSGWLKCNGQAFNKTTYPVLASLYPTGKLPDLRGEFIRGWDDGRKVDPGRSLLSAQNDAMQPITAKWAMDDQAAGGGIDYPPCGALYIDSTARVNYDAVSTRNSFGARGVFDSSLQTRTANETRPRNIAFNYIVRAA